MIRSLVRKELRDQRPFVWIGIVLIAIEVLELLARQPDRQPLGHHFDDLGNPSAVFQLLVAFAVGTGLLMREIEEDTLGLLDGLPLTRSSLFATKVAVAMGVLQIYPVGRVLLFAVQHLTSRDSLNHPVHPHLLLVGLALTAVVTFMGLSLGLLFGYLRSLAWVALGVSAIALTVGIERWPQLSAFNPVGLLDVRLVGFHWRVPMESLFVQLGLGGVLAASAAAIFVLMSGHRRPRLEKWLGRPLISALVGAATIAVALCALTLYTRESPEEAGERRLEETPGSVVMPKEPPGHAATSYYTFSYPAHHSRNLPVLLKAADRTYERVASLLHFETTPVIDVDLSGSSPNTAGTAHLDRIRMDPSVGDPLATLAHETTHVFGLRLAGGERDRELDKMAVFNEGLARWVEHQIVAEGGTPENEILQAAVVSRRHLVSATMLTDLEALARSNDQDLKYPLGAVLVDMFVRRYGSEAPHRLLTTLARADFPRDLEGLELWQAAFQLAGFDLALVFDDYSGRLKSWEREHASAIDRLPRPRGALVRGADRVGVEVFLDNPLPEGWTTLVRFRPTDESPLFSYITQPTDDGIAWISREDLANEEACFQTGLLAAGVTLFEAWTCLPIDAAGVLP